MDRLKPGCSREPHPHRVRFNASTPPAIWGHFLDRNVPDVRRYGVKNKPSGPPRRANDYAAPGPVRPD